MPQLHACQRIHTLSTLHCALMAVAAPPPRRLHAWGEAGEAPVGNAEVFNALRTMYQSSQSSPDVFRMSYAGATIHVVSLLKNASQVSLLFTGPCGGAEDVTSLHCAAACGCVEACDLLLRHCVQLNFHRDSRGQTPLFWAARQGMLRSVELLLLQSADVRQIDAQGRTAVHEAAGLGLQHICQLLLRPPNGGSEVNCQCPLGWSPLHMAAAGGSASTCRTLIEAAADVRSLTCTEGHTPLHLAALRDHAEVAAALVAVDSGLFLVKDASDRTAFDIATELGYANVTSVLQYPHDEHRDLVQYWSEVLHWSYLQHQLAERSGGLDVSVPIIRHCNEQAVELICRVVDLEYRIVEYVLEVRCCEGPQAAAPARLYYARVGEQRKVDDVEFTVPRWRPSSGVAVWNPCKTFQFRLTGRCERCPLATMGSTPWQVASTWSEPSMLQPRGSVRAKSRPRPSRARPPPVLAVEVRNRKPNAMLKSKA